MSQNAFRVRHIKMTQCWYPSRIAKGNDGVDNYTLFQLYKCDPLAPYYGFEPWDKFFARKFRDAVRPVASPHGFVDSSTVIVNACDFHTLLP